MKKSLFIFSFLIILFLVTPENVKANSQLGMSTEYYGNHLNMESREVYDVLKEHLYIQRNTDVITINKKYEVEIIRQGISAFWKDYPQVWWIDVKSFKYSIGNNYSKIILSPIYEGAYDERHIIIQQLDKICEGLRDKVENKNRLEQIRYINLEVSQRFKYLILDDYNKCSNLGSMLKNGVGVCRTAALYFKYICDYYGIDCIYAEGLCKDMGHAINLVLYKNKWYANDPTHDLLGWEKNKRDGDRPRYMSYYVYGTMMMMPYKVSYFQYYYDFFDLNKATEYQNVSTVIDFQKQGYVYDSVSKRLYNDGKQLSYIYNYTFLFPAEDKTKSGFLTKAKTKEVTMIIPDYVTTIDGLKKVLYIEKNAIRGKDNPNVKIVKLGKFINKLESKCIRNCKNLFILEFTSNKINKIEEKAITKFSKDGLVIKGLKNRKKRKAIKKMIKNKFNRELVFRIVNK